MPLTQFLPHANKHCSSWYDHQNNISQAVQIIKLLMCHFLRSPSNSSLLDPIIFLSILAWTIAAEFLHFFSNSIHLFSVYPFNCNEMGWACGAYGWGEGMYRVLLGKPEGRRPLGRPRRRCVENIRMDLQEVGCGYLDWIGQVQDRDRWRTLVSAVMNLRVPWNAGNFLISCKAVSFSRRTLRHKVSKLS